jgi:hypothetical protein
MTCIQNVKTPTLIALGDGDARIPCPQGQEPCSAWFDRWTGR